MLRLATVIIACAIPMALSAKSLAGQVRAQAQGPVQYVVSVDWERFAKGDSDDAHYLRTRLLANSSARYNMQWADRTFKTNEVGDAYMLTHFDESGVRPACSVVYGMAVLLQTGAFNDDAVKIDASQASALSLKLLRAIAGTHVANSKGEKTWGDSWQSALWAALAGCGGWLLWNELDSPLRVNLAMMVEHEADRFVDYRVPYWNGKGGDTKAEENAWNSMILNLAVAMMPNHPHASKWKEKSSELMISAYATKSDWRKNETVVDGRRVKKWLNGYNALPGGVLMNHDIVHPDYMAAISMNFWGLTMQSLAGRPPPEAWDFNASLVYQTLAEKRWATPPFKRPGGTIFRSCDAGVYYPEGTDWSKHDLTAFHLMDTYAHLGGWHKKAEHWMQLRADAMLKMQERHADGRMFAKGEYDTYAGSEQWVFWCLSDAMLPIWIQQQGQFREKENWLAKPSCSGN